MTAERYAELIINQIVPFIGGIRLQKLRSIDIDEWHGKLIAGGRKGGAALTARTVGHAHSLLKKALKEAAEFGLVVRNVATKKPPKVDEEEVKIISEDRLPAILEKLKGHELYPHAVVSLFTGLRRGELLALRWHHVDFDRKVLEVREALEWTKEHGTRIKPPKSKAGRRDITLPDIVVNVLREHRRAQIELRLRLGMGRVPGDDTSYSPHRPGWGWCAPPALSKKWARFAESIGMADVTFHALRHTHASQLIDAGVDIVTSSRRLGHSKPNMTLKVYAHLFRSKDDKASAAVNNWLAIR